MADAQKFDATKLTDTELSSIQHEVTRAVAMRLRGESAEGHDSHSSSHGKNNIVDVAQLGQLAQRTAS